MTFLGGDTVSMDRMSVVCLDGAKILTEQIAGIKAIKGWLYGPSAVVALTYLRRRMVPTLELIAEALSEMAVVLERHADAQRRASAGEKVDFAALPQYRRRTLSPEQRAVTGGVVQAIGGVVQIGGAVIGAASGIGLPAAVVAGGLGVDNLIAGTRSIVDRKPHETGVHQLAEGGARLAGASDKTAWWVGFAADTGAGLTAGGGSTFIKGVGLSEEAAAQAKNTLIVGTKSGGNLGESLLGHNVVGSRLEPGRLHIGGDKSPEVIGDLVKRGAEDTTVSFGTRKRITAETLPDFGYSVRQVEVSADQAQQARQAMRGLETQFAREKQKWSVTGPNCTTAACDVLSAGGLDLPLTARAHPLLLDHALREFPYAGGPGSAIAAGKATSSTGVLGSGSLDKAGHSDEEGKR